MQKTFLKVHRIKNAQQVNTICKYETVLLYIIIYVFYKKRKAIGPQNLRITTFRYVLHKLCH